MGGGLMQLLAYGAQDVFITQKLLVGSDCSRGWGCVWCVPVGWAPVAAALRVRAQKLKCSVVKWVFTVKIYGFKRWFGRLSGGWGVGFLGGWVRGFRGGTCSEYGSVSNMKSEFV
jgi:hypothetical protein